MGCVSVPSKEEFLQSIQPGMKLTKDFFKKVYGYEISWSGFAEQAIKALEVVGCSYARQYYDDWVTAYETEYNTMMKRVAEWYTKFCESNERKVKKSRAKQERPKQQNRQQQWTELSEMLGYQSTIKEQ